MFATTSSSSSRRAAAPYDEERVSPLVESLEAAVHRRCPVLPQSEVPASESLTYFHSKTLPRASVKTFVRAIVKARVGFTWTSVAIALSLVQRYRRVHGDASVTPHMLHRMLIACLLVGAKAHADVLPSNRLIAKTIGVVPEEVHRLELTLCLKLKWRLCVTRDDVADMMVPTVRRGSRSSLGSSLRSSSQSSEPGRQRRETSEYVPSK
uniref:Cyclin N-terminal domain-containing protein n=1 Tax=Neobodo designis TaxID=312471 RepID=A0A7S1L8E0_NEODS|mmetsp:Transcript_16908/g.52515  ORF Transcript_16908/g.52515 Transcript_16908/m.52515 type:complete len:209 (+) Transcript_16908:66-692(+)